MTADSAISRARRDITLSAAIRLSLIVGTIVCIVWRPDVDRGTVLFLFIAAWMGLSFGSAKGSRLVAVSPVLIALGRFDEAESTLDQAMRSFSIFRSAKVMTLHQLAILRFRQQHWADAAKLSQAVLSQRTMSKASLARPSRLMLADSLLHLNDLPGAYAQISILRKLPLSLMESVQLMVLQLDYELRLSAWDSALSSLRQKLDWCELLSPPEAARVQAVLAIAADQSGRADVAQWMFARLQLLTDVPKLVERYSQLSSLMNRG